MKIKKLLTGALVFVITFLLIYLQAFYGWDKLVGDVLCQTGGVPSRNIYIAAIDDKTLATYGKWESSWGREKCAQLVELLNADEATAPAAIGFDILYIEEGDREIDDRLARACGMYDNVVVAMNVQFKETPKVGENGKIYFDKFHVNEYDFPYAALKEQASYGFANTTVDDDGYVRHSLLTVDDGNERINSLAYTIYNKYKEKLGETDIFTPITDKSGMFSFAYTGRPGKYSVVSLCDILEGKVPGKLFQNSIVLVGAYAIGMQDSYTPAISHGAQMYGVEIHANIIDALMQGKTKQETNPFPTALMLALLTTAVYFVLQKLKVVPAGIMTIALMGGYLVFVKAAYGKGWILPVILFPSIIFLLYIEAVVEGYITEIKRRRKIVGVFKQYVAPQIVEEISKQKDFSIALGGRKRHIAVLFVDIRGFTTMSESLDPEEVVEILNEYLALTTDSIFRNSGTLDKFVGDATMAVFNSPFDLDDYIFRAVKSAWDMKAGSEALAKKFEERFGKSVAFGIGVNCGEAVVGNIGCEFRMDYTAIGDTVNTAARLESNAKRGQILISAEVYEAVKDRVSVTPIGEIPLKGKANGVFVYQVDDVREE